jgi:hypothetical protein
MIDVVLAPGSLRKLLWSGIALKRFPFPLEVNDAIMRDAFGAVIPAVATNPFQFFNELYVMMHRMTEFEGNHPRLFANSLMVVWDAQTVPLKPTLMRMNQSLRSALLAANDKMANFYPVGLSRENIGSNVGLSKIMRKFYIDKGMHLHSCTRYTTFSLDVNIYDRVLKVFPHSYPRDHLHIAFISAHV